MGKDKFLNRLLELGAVGTADNIQAYVSRLSREKGLLNTIFDTIREGVLVIDRKLRIQYANRAAVGMLGIPEDKIGKMRISRFIRDVDWKRMLHEDEAEWERVSRGEIEILYPQPRVVNFYLVPHEGDRGLATLMLHDITESRRHQDSRVESERFNSISLLAAGIAHEIGNPLNSLSLLLQLLRRRLKDDEIHRAELCELVATADAEVERLDGTIKRFLEAVRPTWPQMAAVSLHELIVETLKFMRHEFENRSIQVKCSWPDFLPNISADGDQLKQAFYNILKNAIQSMPDGGVVEINCEFGERRVAISFTDAGGGIEADKLGAIFDPYYTTKASGSGLGLMIVERIVRDHGAELLVESNPGKGTTFTINFPRNDKRMILLPPSSDADIHAAHLEDEATPDNDTNNNEVDDHGG